MQFATDSVVVLNAVSTTGSSSQWINVQDYQDKNFEITFSVGGTVKIMASNSPTQPDSSVDGPQYGSSVSSSSIVTVSDPVKWLKLKVIVLSGGGTVTAYLFGQTFDNAKY